MTTQTKKYRLIHQILQINDDLLLETVQNLLDFGLKHQKGDSLVAEADFWDELSDQQKLRIKYSIRQMEEGEGIAHEEVMIF